MSRTRAALVALLTSALAAASLLWPAQAFAQLLGDGNADGAVDFHDAEHIADFAFGYIAFVNNPANADVNRDGIVDVRDALAIGQAGVTPLILFTNPSSNDAVVNDSTVVVKGVVLVHSLTSISAFTINGSPVALNNGAFAQQIQLVGGQNIVTASATEAIFGQNSQRQLRIHYLKVSSLSVPRGRPGDTVTINGAGFDPAPGKMFVFFYPSKPATINSLTATTIQVTIPNDVGTLKPGEDGITVVRKAKNGNLVPTKKPAAFFPRRHEQIQNHAIDPDSVKTVQQCTAAGGQMINGFCIRRIAMRPNLNATGGLQGLATVAPPTNVTSTPAIVPAQAGSSPGLAEIEMDTGWFYTESYYASDAIVQGTFPLLAGVLAADFTHTPIGTGSYDVTTILDDRNPAPLIYLQNPPDGLQTQAASISVYGSVNNSSVTIQNQSIPYTITVGTNITYFQANVPLKVGANTIVVTATDALNRTATATRTVTRIPLVTIKYRIQELEPQITPGGADPDPAKKNASGINLASLLILLNGNTVPMSSLVFKDNEAGSVAFDPGDLSVKRYDVTVEFKPGITELNNGLNSTLASCRDNAGNQMMAPEVASFNANY
jgi:hypothetical protein